MKDVRDFEVEEPLPLNYGIGIEFDYSGCKFRTVQRDKKEGAYVKLDISSWVGISAFAQHTYGDMKLPWLEAECLKAEKGHTLFKKGSISGGSVVWSLGLIDKIRVTRPVTKSDLKLDGGNAFKGFRLNEPTHRFDTEEWLIDKSKREFKRIFAPGWTLYTERMRQINKKNEPEFWETYKEILVKADER